MLVLSRQRDESIMVGDNVQITIVDIRGDKVRLGIVAPSENIRSSQGSVRRHSAGEPQGGRGYDGRRSGSGITATQQPERTLTFPGSLGARDISLHFRKATNRSGRMANGSH